MKRAYSLRARLVIAMMCLFVLGLAGTAGFYYMEVLATGDDLKTRTLQSQARALAAALDLAAGAVQIDLPDDWKQAYADPASGFRYALYRDTGELVAQSPNSPDAVPLPDDHQWDRLYFSGTGPDRMVMFAKPALSGYAIAVGRSGAQEDVLVDSLLGENYEYVVLVLLPLVFTGALLIWLVSGWSLRPLTRASAEAAAIGPGSLDKRIGSQGLPGELQPLVAAVNAALERVTSAYAAERAFTAHAAHELRTPLSVLHLRLQDARLNGRMDWKAIDEDVAQLRRLVNQLLDLARKESVAEQDQTSFSQVDIARVAREAAAAVLPLAESAGRELQVDAPEAALTLGNAPDLRDMLRNLLENALVHGQGAIRVAVQTSASDGAHWIDVTDEGAGVPDALREAVFERFCKASPASPGAGLGLAIARQVARSHRGDIHFMPDDQGCCIRVSLPIVSQPAHSWQGSARNASQVYRSEPASPSAAAASAPEVQ